MRTFAFALLLLAACATVPAAQAVQAAVQTTSPAASRAASLPAGTILPVSLDGGLRADRVHPGTRIQATVMQSIPGTPVHRGARLIGQVVAVSGGSAGSPAPTLTVSFTTLRLRHSTIPVAVSLRAMASLLQVEEAETPEDMAMRGTVPENATTRQIGGQQVYRGGGPVAEGMTPVGKPVPYGTIALPLTSPGHPCRAQVASNSHAQAFWLFSSDACGLFGLQPLRLAHAGRTTGQIVFTTRPGHKLSLQSGSGLLLRVLPAAI